jgi:hypothetical protein
MILFFLHDMLAYVCESLDKKEHSLMIVYRKLAGGHPNFPKEPRKIRERAAKDANDQVNQSPCKVSMLLATFFWRKPVLLLSSFHFLSSFSLPFLLLRWADEVCEETVGKHIALNARLNLSISFSCDYRLSPFTAKGPRKRLL